MARFNNENQDQYGAQGLTGFFGLKDDKETAAVRFMYRDMRDVEGMTVHEIEVDGKRKKIECLKQAHDPDDVCPFCAAGMKLMAKVYVPVFDIDTQEVKIWERGKSIMSKLSGLSSRFNPLVSTPFEIERNGKRGDTNTTYETYALESDNMQLEDLPELPQVIGTLVLVKSADEMNHFLDTGSFPGDQQQAPAQQRQPAQDNRRQRQPQQQSGRQRQTPADGGQRQRPTRNTQTQNRAAAVQNNSFVSVDDDFDDDNIPF